MLIEIKHWHSVVQEQGFIYHVRLFRIQYGDKETFNLLDFKFPQHRTMKKLGQAWGKGMSTHLKKGIKFKRVLFVRKSVPL